MDIDTIRTSCLERWQDQDERTKYFEEKLPESIEHMNSEMQEIFFELLSRFDYYSHKYWVNLYTKDAQYFILDHLDDFSNIYYWGKY